MEEDTKIARIIVTGLVTAFCILVVTAGGCVANTHNRISQDLRAGISPVAVACAHSSDGGTNACLLLSAK